MAYGDFKNLTRKKPKYSRDKALKLLKIQNMMDMKGVLRQWFINFSIKNPLCLQINLVPVKCVY